MAKRFVDTSILKHHFTRSLSAQMKLLWLHLLTDCNYAGMWQVDWDIASIVVGSKIDPKKAEEIFAGKIRKVKNGAIWFMPDFIDFQYGKLNEKIAAHKTIIKLLKKENLMDENGNVEPLPKGSVTLTEGLQEKEKEKEKEKEIKGVQGEKQIFEEMEHPFIEKIRIEFPILQKLKSPLTQKEAERLEVDIGIEKVNFLLEKMANWGNILKKNSVNLTLRDWHNKDLKENGSKNSNSSGKENSFGRIPESSVREYLNRPPLTLDN